MLLQILAVIKNYQYSKMKILLINFLNSFKYFVRLISLSWVIFKRICEMTVFISLFFKNKQGVRACVLSNFHPRLKKMLIVWKISNFHPELKLHLGIWVEIFTCYCKIILKRNLIFSCDEISTRFNELKFQLGLRFSI